MNVTAEEVEAAAAAEEAEAEVSPADRKKDPAWCFAPVGVFSHLERDTINGAQIKAFAAEAEAR